MNEIPESLFDKGAIETLRQLMGDNYPRLVGSFLTNAENYIGAIGDALEAGDRAAASSTAHKMKSSCGQFGLLELQALAKAIERCEEPGLDAMKANQRLLRPAYDRALEFLRQNKLDR